MTKERALEVLDQIPTIGEQVDALELAIEALESKKEGTWFKTNNPNFSPFDGSRTKLFTCTVCNHTQYQRSKYCPNCGSYNGELRED